MAWKPNRYFRIAADYKTGAFQKIMKTQRGFTITEILTAMTVGIIVVGAIYSIVIMARKSAGAIELRSAADQDVRAALEIMSLEIQMASYNPKHKFNMWKKYNDPKEALAPEQINKGIQEATTTSITIEMDLNGNEQIAAIKGDENEVIRYEYVATESDHYITRSTNGGSAQPLLGAAFKSTTPKTVRVVNGDTPVFKYYDGKGFLIDKDLNANIPNIRRIEITLIVETDELSPDTGLRRKMTYTTCVIPRNHAVQ